MSAMTYKGYHARVEFEPNDGVFAGRLAGINDIITFEADTVKGLEEAFREAVDDYLATCQSLGKDPQKPYSGKMMFRVAPEVHARAALAAELSGTSLNQWAEKALDEAARQVV